MLNILGTYKPWITKAAIFLLVSGFMGYGVYRYVSSIKAAYASQLAADIKTKELAKDTEIAQNNQTIGTLTSQIAIDKSNLAKAKAQLAKHGVDTTPTNTIAAQTDVITSQDSVIASDDKLVAEQKAQIQAEADAITLGRQREKSLETVIANTPKVRTWSADILYGKNNKGETRMGAAIGKSVGPIHGQVILLGGGSNGVEALVGIGCSW